MESNKRKPAFQSSAHLTHSCFRCSERFANSGQLVQHMKEMHTSFVEHPPSSNMPRPYDSLHERSDTPYKNSIATCPFCNHECLTRKKLMLHLELEHKDKDDNDSTEDEPRIKFIRLDNARAGQLMDDSATTMSSHTTSAGSDTNVVRNLLQAIGPANANTATTSLTKVESKPSNTNKLQYKCFWCEASFRKRGKLMDHIDKLHKHNKQQNQVEAEMLSLDDPTRQLNRLPSSSAMPFNPNAMFRPHSAVPSTVYHDSSSSSGSTALSNTRSSHHSFTSAVSRPDINTFTEIKYKQSQNLCSFNLLGSLKPTPKPKCEQTRPVNICKFYLGKEGNAIASARYTPVTKAAANFPPINPNATSRRYSLPNLLEGASSNTLTNFPYPYRLMAPSASTMAAAMQQNYLLGLRPPFFPQSFYPPPRMPMMLPPCSSTLTDRAQTSPRQQTAQFLNRMGSLNQNIRSSPRPNPTHSDSPLDLTKSYL